ncbi:hypothetical protein BCR36DRAFT_585202 [Piromyces finnis]|uniref:Uncharacterized protein n=1 Tax=Piromyces finnis TaxID=1754191 RepID=A0A1Y1V3D2_9FUNG|nr:hypothetical protein BCR36DRAFT_585202 [Piromyces finnis]|eukprot:ORX46386.1 hypothetical protein BCR36DRAFT_585202 [Piromyces finnis]
MSDRAVNNIYDAIYNENYRLALTLSNKALKKFHNDPAINAMKSLALVKLEKYEEAEEIAKFVMESKPVEETILQALNLTLKDLQKYDEIVELFQNAFEADITNEEYANQYFMAITRINNYDLQKQTALKLNKLFSNSSSNKKGKYFCWAIMSLILQSRYQKDCPKALITKLAEQMILKAIEKDFIIDYEGLFMYLTILIDQERYKEALDILNGDLGSKCIKIETERNRLNIELNRKTKQWEQLIKVCQDIIENNDHDNFTCFYNIIDALFILIEENVLAIDYLNNETFINVYDWIKKIQEEELKNGISKIKRAPFIAEIELEKKIINMTGFTMDKHKNILIEYVKKFGDKYCCFEDLLPYLEILDSDELINDFKAELNKLIKSTDINVNDIQRNVNIEKINFYLGYKINNEEEMKQYVKKLISLYEETLPFGTKLEDTERQFGDDYLVIAASLLIDYYKLTDKTCYIYQAIAILEHGLEKSKFNFQFKIILMRLYSILGDAFRTTELSRSLNLRSIQFDTLSFLYTEGMDSLNIVQIPLHIYNLCLSIYKSNNIEVPDVITQAYKNETYSKIIEILDFYNKLNNSIQQVLFHQQIIRIQTLQAFNTVDKVNSYLSSVDDKYIDITEEYLSKCTDNRDYKVFAHWKNEKTTLEEKIRCRPLKNTLWIQLFGLIPKILKNIALKNIEKIKADNEKLTALLSKDNLISELLPSEIANGKIVNEFAKFVIEADQSKETKESGSCDAFNNIFEILKEKVDSLTSNNKLTNVTFNIIEQCTTMIEAINYIVLLVHYASNIAPNRKSRNLPWVINIQEKKSQFVNEIKKQIQIFYDYLKELNTLINSKKNTGIESIKEIFGSDEALIDNLMSNNKELLIKTFDQWQSSVSTSLENTLKETEIKMKLL